MRGRPHDVLLDAVTGQQAQPYRMDRRDIALLCGLLEGREAVRLGMCVVLPTGIEEERNNASAQPRASCGANSRRASAMSPRSSTASKSVVSWVGMFVMAQASFLFAGIRSPG
jgi:hypothetical protein